MSSLLTVRGKAVVAITLLSALLVTLGSSNDETQRRPDDQPTSAPSGQATLDRESSLLAANYVTTASTTVSKKSSPSQPDSERPATLPSAPSASNAAAGQSTHDEVSVQALVKESAERLELRAALEQQFGFVPEAVETLLRMHEAGASKAELRAWALENAPPDLHMRAQLARFLNGAAAPKRVERDPTGPGPRGRLGSLQAL